MITLRWAAMVLGCLGVMAGPAVSQDIVHAITGTVVKVDPAAHRFVIAPADGSDGVYKLSTEPQKLEFNRDVKAGTLPAATYTKIGAQVLLFYTGFEDDKTAVAVQELSGTTLDKVVGAIVKYDKHEVTIAGPKGVQTTFAIDPKTVAETDLGVVPGAKANPHKGLQVRVVATKENGVETALFVRSLGV